MSGSLDLDLFRDIPGYKGILKAVLKSQIQLLVHQLSESTGEESVLLSANVTEGTISHLGSDSGKNFLVDSTDVKRRFLGYCLKRHQTNKSQFMVPGGGNKGHSSPQTSRPSWTSQESFNVRKSPYYPKRSRRHSLHAKTKVLIPGYAHSPKFGQISSTAKTDLNEGKQFREIPSKTAGESCATKVPARRDENTEDAEEAETFLVKMEPDDNNDTQNVDKSRCLAAIICDSGPATSSDQAQEQRYEYVLAEDMRSNASPDTMTSKPDQAPTNKRKSVIPIRRTREQETNKSNTSTDSQPVFPGHNFRNIPKTVDHDDHAKISSLNESGGAESSTLTWNEEKLYDVSSNGECATPPNKMFKLSGNTGSPSDGVENVSAPDLQNMNYELDSGNMELTESGGKSYMKTPQIDGLLVSRGEGRYEKLIRCDICGKVCRTSNMARHKRRYCTGVPGLSPRRRGRPWMKVDQTGEIECSGVGTVSKFDLVGFESENKNKSSSVEGTNFGTEAENDDTDENVTFETLGGKLFGGSDIKAEKGREEERQACETGMEGQSEDGVLEEQIVIKQEPATYEGDYGYGS